jgi:hypothetical protein
MIEAMSADQRKTLHENAMKRDTVASRDVLDLLAKIAPKSPPAAAKKAPAKKAAATKKKAAPVQEPEETAAPWDE